MPYIGNEAGNRFVASKSASVYSGDGSDTTFTLEHSVGSDEDILVSVDGVIQEPSVAYAVSNGTTLTFTAAPSSNSGNNIFVYYLFRTVATVDHPSTSSLQATDATFTGAVTANAGIKVDNITIDGNEIDLSSGDFTLDVGDNIILDSGDGDIEFRDTGTTFMNLYESSNHANFYNPISDADIKFQGNDGGSTITALTLDMSDAGTATFNHDVILPYNGVLAFNSVSNQYVTADSSNLYIGSGGSGRIIIDTSGHTTMPHQPAFSVTKSGNQNNLANSDTVTFETEIFDQNADFASNTFTAPVTGRYHIDINLGLLVVDSASAYIGLHLDSSNRNYFTLFDPDFGQDASYWEIHFSGLVDMDANDTVFVKYLQSGGSTQTDVSASHTNFSGYLVC